MAETMNGLKRTHYCGEFGMKDVGSEVVACGWVQRQRDLGQLIFIDLRDRTGVVQLAFDEAAPRDIFEKAFTARAEFVPVSYTHLDVYKRQNQRSRRF